MTKNPNDTFTVFSSHGEITARCMDGTVTELNLNLETWGEEIPVQFDIEEWERHYTESIAEVSGIDILDIGYWYYSNKLHVLEYCPPCEEARRNVLEARFETLETTIKLRTPVETAWDKVKEAVNQIPCDDATTTDYFWECHEGDPVPKGTDMCPYCAEDRSDDQPDARLRDVIIRLIDLSDIQS